MRSVLPFMQCSLKCALGYMSLGTAIVAGKRGEHLGLLGGKHDPATPTSRMITQAVALWPLRNGSRSQCVSRGIKLVLSSQRDMHTTDSYPVLEGLQTRKPKKALLGRRVYK